MRILRVLLYLFLLAQLMYRCVPPCTARYPKQTQLSIHQGSCAHASAHDPSLDDALRKRQGRKRRRMERAAGGNTPEASTSAAPTLGDPEDELVSIQFFYLTIRTNS